MKKLFIGTLIAIASYGYGQSYFSVSVGYGMGVPGETSFESDRDTNNEGTVRIKNLNLGGGINAVVSYGIPISENVHLDLALSYQNNFGASTESKDYIMDFDPNFNPIWIEEVSTNTISTSSFRFAPSIRFSGEGNLRPFAQVGPQVILASMKTKFENEAGSNSSLTEEKYNMSVSVGATASIGVEFEIAEDMMFFASVNANLGFYSPSSSEVVTYEVNDQDMLDQLDVADKEWEYEKELSTEDWLGGDPDEPSKELRMRYDYSSIGINFGVRILL